jgi:hypothetical protein
LAKCPSVSKYSSISIGNPSPDADYCLVAKTLRGAIGVAQNAPSEQEQREVSAVDLALAELVVLLARQKARDDFAATLAKRDSSSSRDDPEDAQ